MAKHILYLLLYPIHLFNAAMLKWARFRSLKDLWCKVQKIHHFDLKLQHAQRNQDDHSKMLAEYIRQNPDSENQHDETNHVKMWLERAYPWLITFIDWILCYYVLSEITEHVYWLSPAFSAWLGTAILVALELSIGAFKMSLKSKLEASSSTQPKYRNPDFIKYVSVYVIAILLVSFIPALSISEFHNEYSVEVTRFESDDIYTQIAFDNTVFGLKIKYFTLAALSWILHWTLIFCSHRVFVGYGSISVSKQLRRYAKKDSELTVIRQSYEANLHQEMASYQAALHLHDLRFGLEGVPTPDLLSEPCQVLFSYVNGGEFQSHRI